MACHCNLQNKSVCMLSLHDYLIISTYIRWCISHAYLTNLPSCMFSMHCHCCNDSDIYLSHKISSDMKLSYVINDWWQNIYFIISKHWFSNCIMQILKCLIKFIKINAIIVLALQLQDSQLVKMICNSIIWGLASDIDQEGCKDWCQHLAPFSMNGMLHSYYSLFTSLI